MRHPSGAGTGQQHPEEEMLFVPRSQFLLPEHHNSDFPYLFYPTPRSREAQWCTEESSDQGRAARKSALLGQRHLCAFLPGPFQIPVQERAGQAPEGLWAGSRGIPGCASAGSSSAATSPLPTEVTCAARGSWWLRCPWDGISSASAGPGLSRRAAGKPEQSSTSAKGSISPDSRHAMCLQMDIYRCQTHHHSGRGV